jgi:hypothetical protein
MRKSTAFSEKARLFVVVNEGATTEIGTENAIDLESLSTEFQFIGLWRQVTELASQHPYVEVIRLQLVIMDLQRQLTG